YAGEDLHLVRLRARGGQRRLPGPPPIQRSLDVLPLQGHAGRAAVDHRAQRRSMALPEGGEPEQLAEGVHPGREATSALSLGPSPRTRTPPRTSARAPTATR